VRRSMMKMTGLVRILVVTVALVAFGLLLEHSASAPTITKVQAPAFQTVANTSNQAGKSEQHAKHCNDGKGKDGEKNKHCRPASG
jgi:hypothetical protein